jgi:hypothetical protein
VTGPEHYREAEKAIERAASAGIGSAGGYHLARAQAHATLALAAAAWADAISGPTVSRS